MARSKHSRILAVSFRNIANLQTTRSAELGALRRGESPGLARLAISDRLPAAAGQRDALRRTGRPECIPCTRGTGSRRWPAGRRAHTGRWRASCRPSAPGRWCRSDKYAGRHGESDAWLDPDEPVITSLGRILSQPQPGGNAHGPPGQQFQIWRCHPERVCPVRLIAPTLCVQRRVSLRRGDSSLDARRHGKSGINPLLMKCKTRCFASSSPQWTLCRRPAQHDNLHFLVYPHDARRVAWPHSE